MHSRCMLALKKFISVYAYKTQEVYISTFLLRCIAVWKLKSYHYFRDLQKGIITDITYMYIYHYKATAVFGCCCYYYAYYNAYFIFNTIGHIILHLS